MAARSAPAPAEAVRLRFASPDDPGYTRRRAGKGFRFVDPDGRPVTSRADLARFRALVIPPAWTEVWISADPNGHLQAVGRDARGRRQYRYHPQFRARRDRDKFTRLIRFGAALPKIRRRVRADLGTRGLSREKVIAAVVALLDSTHLRVGNAEYARVNKSFGLSTLRRRHASVTGASIAFRFRGKGGRMEERRLVDRRLAALVRRCQELPGQALFQYPDADDPSTTHKVSSEDVNDYIRDAAGSEEFSAKDFRTWAATLVAFRAMGAARAAVTITAEVLGDTPTVTRNSYIHPAVLDEIDAAPRASTRERDHGIGRARAAAQPTRREELALLAFLRHARWSSASRASAAGASATRSKAAARPRASRSGRRAA